MTATILLIRHGETAWNRGKIFRGTYDVPLNENGEKQAKFLAKALGSRQIDAAYISPLSRAQKTAQIVLENRGIDAVIDERLIDFDYGEWTGLEESEVARRWLKEHNLWISHPESVRVPGGNTLQEVYETAFSAMEEFASRHQNQTVALFAHRVVNKLLVLGAMGLGIERFPFIRQDNSCLNEFERTKGGYVICSLNDTCHIRQANIDVLTEDF